MTERPTPSLEECVTALASQPDHPRAALYAWKVMFVMDRQVEQGRLKKEQRDRYYSLLGDILFPPNDD